MKKHYHFSRQRAQLRHLGKKILDLQQTGQQIPAKMLAKFRAACKRLLPKIGHRGLQQALGAAAFMIGMSTGVQAQDFADPVVNPFGFDNSVLTEAYYNFAAFADLDNDGDLDMMTAFGIYDYGDEAYTTFFYYYENTGTAQAPQFAAPQLNPFGIPVFQSEVGPIELVDVDGDGDLDILTTGFNYEGGANGEGATFLISNEGNISNPTFGSLQVNGLPLPTPGIVDNAVFLTLGDLDGDGDLDILGNSYDEDGIDGTVNFYYENTSTGDGIVLAAPILNPFGIENGNTLADLVEFSDLADLDNDGDLDLLTGNVSYTPGSGLYDFQIEFLENSGTSTAPSFEAPVANPFGIELVGDPDEAPRSTAVDIDDDGDLDLFTFFGSQLLYQENVAPSSTSEQADQLELSLFPNPTDGLIELNTTERIARVEVSDLVGRQILSLSGPLNELDLSSYPSGIYLMKIVTEDNRFQVYRLRKQ
ncbi:MAG: T9SS type A sorting domain-containing protein [Bacteroidota bacterium]